MGSLWRRLKSIFSGERRHSPRFQPERVDVTNRQYEVARVLASRLGTTPEELLDYRHADRILGSRR